MGLRTDDDRIIAPPLLSLLDRGPGRAELDRVLAARRPAGAHPPGADRQRAVARPIRSTTRSGRASTRPGYRWRSTSTTTATPRCQLAWGEDPDPPVREMSAFQWAFVHGDRPIMETFGALIYGNMFGRFPNLRRAQHRERLRLGPLPAHPARQEEGHGPVRALGRWSPDRTAQRHLPSALLRVAVPRGRCRGA